MKGQLEEEARLATDMLVGKTVRQLWRHRAGEVGIKYTDGSRLFVDHHEEGLEISITGACEAR